MSIVFIVVHVNVKKKSTYTFLLQDRRNRARKFKEEVR